MPKSSERERFIGEIIDVMAVAVLEEDDDDEFGLSMDFDDAGGLWSGPVEDLQELLLAVQGSRFLMERQVVPKSVEFAERVFNRLPDYEFRQLTRMTRASFDRVLGEIADHPVFHNGSTCSQKPVWLQLAVALDRLGNYGNGASVGRTHKLWGVGWGTCCLYTDRVLTALESLVPKYVRWPSAAERRAMSARMEAKGFRGCVGFIDGTTIPLAQKPAVDGECFFDRKQRYSVNAQVVCDDRRRIIAFYSGWTGSCADSTVYRAMKLGKNEYKRAFFSPGEYLLADSAYPADHDFATIVPSYKSNSRGQDNDAFNTCVAHLRVVNEHTIGVWKGRFSSLRELRIQIKEPADMERILKWETGCVVLHNMLIAFRDEWTNEDQEGDEEHDDAAPENEGEDDEMASEDNDNYAFRRALKARAIAKAREPGGILWYRGM